MLGGFLTTYVSWHWIFIINVPMGLAGIVLATIYIEDVKAESARPVRRPRRHPRRRRHCRPYASAARCSGSNFLPTGIVIALLAVGAAAAVAYVMHARKHAGADPRPLAAAVPDAARRRGRRLRSIAAASAAMPFLLPLFLQLGFGLTAFQSGLITVANVFGALGMKTIIPIVLRTFGFRMALAVNAVVSSAMVGPARPSRPACRSPGSWRSC